MISLQTLMEFRQLIKPNVLEWEMSNLLLKAIV